MDDAISAGCTSIVATSDVELPDSDASNDGTSDLANFDVVTY